MIRIAARCAGRRERAAGEAPDPSAFLQQILDDVPVIQKGADASVVMESEDALCEETGYVR